MIRNQYSSINLQIYLHTHTYTHIYIYILVLLDRGLSIYSSPYTIHRCLFICTYIRTQIHFLLLASSIFTFCLNEAGQWPGGIYWTVCSFSVDLSSLHTLSLNFSVLCSSTIPFGGPQRTDSSSLCHRPAHPPTPHHLLSSLLLQLQAPSKLF